MGVALPDLRGAATAPPLAVKGRVQRAVTTWPGARAWLETLVITGVFSVVALAVGLTSGFLHPETARTAAPPLLLRTFAVPALLEELLFRVLPPPRLWPLMLAAYVLFHPLNAWLFLPEARDVFYDPAFLSLSALLGGGCALLYRRTRSLWPPVVMHWLVVAGWLLFLGGEGALR